MDWFVQIMKQKQGSGLSSTLVKDYIEEYKFEFENECTQGVLVVVAVSAVADGSH